jgi:hypothetical protein
VLCCSLCSFTRK